MNRKAFDKDAMFWDAQSTAAWGTGTQNSASVDLKAADIDQDNPGDVQIRTTGLGSGGAATLAITLQDSADNSAFAAVTPMGIASAAIAFDDAQFASDIIFTIPKTGMRRYVRLSIVIGAAALNAGSITAGLVK